MSDVLVASGERFNNAYEHLSPTLCLCGRERERINIHADCVTEPPPEPVTFCEILLPMT